MFQESFVETSRNFGTRAVALPLAVAFHAAVILGLIVGPLLQVVKLPRWTITSALLVPPPPPPALPAAGRPRPKGVSSRIHPVVLRADSGDARLIAPVRIPDEIPEETLSGGGTWSDLTGGDFDQDAGPVNEVIGQIIGDVEGDSAAVSSSMSVIRPPRLIKKVDPEYPEIARQARVFGAVKVEATTDVYGRVKDVRILESVPLLDQAALDAVRQWIYEPMVVNGKPRCVSFAVTVRFILAQH